MTVPISQPLETVIVDTMKVVCDGDAASPHPRVFLTLVGGSVDCGYCGKHYVLREGASAHAGH